MIKNSRLAITRASLIALFFTGAIEVAWGFYMGRLTVYSLEAPMAREIALAPENAQAFGRYISRIKGIFAPCGYMGIATLCASTVGLVASAASPTRHIMLKQIKVKRLLRGKVIKNIALKIECVNEKARGA